MGEDVVVQPFQEHSIGTFHELDLAKLDHDTAYSHTFSNRSVAYYGSVGYHYNGGTHEPSPISQNKYLEQVILKIVRKHHPNFQFNSVLITRYANGDEFIPYHSDNEVCIDPTSSILTISLGECRQLCFRPKSQRKLEVCLPLHHGDAVLMTKFSQDFFEHSIPRDSTKKVRISITLRNLLTPTPQQPIKNHSYASKVSSNKTSSCANVGSTLCAPRLELDPDVKHLANTNCSFEKQRPKSSTVYISSSMFSALDSGKLSSKEQDATVFSYPGATVSTMHKKFQSDPKASKIDSQSVQRIFLLTGTNNIDDILNSPREMRNKIIDPTNNCSMEKLTKTFDCIESFVTFLKGWAPSAKIILLKLLPRESRARNVVITRINSYLHCLASKYDNVKLLDFEKDRYLFADDAGYRKSDFFSANGEDNVHLNRRGVVRLANHLKYIAHGF
jgi:alkylated DNA repair dioxygenase AlkB